MGSCWSSSDGRAARRGDKEMRNTAARAAPGEANNNGVRILMFSSSQSSPASSQEANNSIAKKRNTLAHDNYAETRGESESAMQTSVCANRRSSAPTSASVLGESVSVSTAGIQTRPTLLTRLMQATGSTRRRFHQSAKIDCDHQPEQLQHDGQNKRPADPSSRGRQQDSVGRKRKSRESPSGDKMHAGETGRLQKNHEDHQRAPDESPVGLESDSEHVISLFTSIRQLCFEIISKRVLGQLNEAPEGSASGRAICLFMFGRQGSCKGEIAFELVGHSALLRALDDRQPARAHRELECPLYHHLDVATMIVTNLDARILEYNQLVERTARNRLREQQLLALAKNDSSSVSSGRTDNDTHSDITEKLSAHTDKTIAPDNGGNERGSSDSMSSSSSSSNCSRTTAGGGGQEGHRSSWTIDDFGLITLSTKHRSILQLKLMKYHNSITSKWVFSLIQSEIERLELRVRDKFGRETREEQCGGRGTPDRVYLVNLIPNQLSLFKGCLYLQQAPALSKFTHANYAIKFERRTNIRLLTKDRLAGEQAKGDKSAARSQASIRLRFPTILGVGQGSRNSARQRGDKGASERPQDGQASLGELAATVGGDKLGPKFNDTFAQHFARLNKLVQVRYNPTKDYNYAHEEEEGEGEESGDNDEDAKSADEDSLMEEQCERRDEFNRRAVRRSGTREWARGRGQPASTSRRRRSCSQLPSAGSRAHPPGVRAPGGQLRSADRALSASMQEVHASSLCLTSSSLRPPDRPDSLGSSLVSVLSAPQLVRAGEQQPAEGGALARKSAPIKWAVELQLFDSREQSDDGANSRGRQQVAPLALYSASGSPTAAASVRDYALVGVRVAYANEHSQLMLEAQRVHSRALKLKGRADVGRLAKLVRKANRQLQMDCSRWLFEAVERSCGAADLEGPGGRRRQTSGASQPALIVYSIPLDVARLTLDEAPARGVAAAKATGERAKLATANSLGPPERPSSAQPSRPHSALSRPTSSRSMVAGQPGDSAPVRPPKRHVQFRLSPAPRGADEEAAEHAGRQLRPQRRLWICDSLFASAADRRALELLPGLAALLAGSLAAS